MDKNYIRVNTTSTISLETLGIIVGTVLCILQGTGVINIGWFWATFPFWAPIALGLAIYLLLFIVVFIAVLIDNRT